MFASNNDARANATPKTILLDMARSQSVIELTRQPVSSGWEITTERVKPLASQMSSMLWAAKLTRLSSQQHGCERIMHFFRRLSGSRHRSAIYLVDLRARTNHIVAREMCRVSCKRSEST